jgi:hypothetical protein
MIAAIAEIVATFGIGVGDTTDGRWRGSGEPHRAVATRLRPYY